MENKDFVYTTLGIENKKEEKPKKNKAKKLDDNKVSLKSFIEKNFNVMKI